MRTFSSRQINILKKRYKQDGFVKVKNLLSKKEINQIKSSLFEFIENNSKSLSGRDVSFVKNSKIINSIHNLKKWNLVKRIQNNYQIKKLAKNMIGEKIQNFGAELFAKPAKKGLQTPIHQDNHYWHIQTEKENFFPNGPGLTIWIALEKSTKRNGAVFYFKKSHQVGLLEHVFLKKKTGLSQELKHKNLLKLFKKQTPELNIGDALIHNCMIVHGSNLNKSLKSRLGLTMRFISKNSFINQYFKKKYDLELNKLKKSI